MLYIKYIYLAKCVRYKYIEMFLGDKLTLAIQISQNNLNKPQLVHTAPEGGQLHVRLLAQKLKTN